jgi:hypothetical protein
MNSAHGAALERLRFLLPALLKDDTCEESGDFDGKVGLQLKDV